MTASDAKRPIQVLVAIGHDDFRASLVVMLATQATVEVVGEAATGTAALAAAQACPPDVVVLDMRLPDAVGPRLIRRLHLMAPAARVILLTPEDGPEYGVLAARWGATTYLSWDQVDRELLAYFGPW